MRVMNAIKVSNSEIRNLQMQANASFPTTYIRKLNLNLQMQAWGKL